MTQLDHRQRTESLIRSALKHGKKRQIELVKLVNRSKSTVRTHLQKLEEQGEIEKTKECGKVYYYLPDSPQEPVEPLPLAKDGEVGVMLDTIADSIGVIDEPEYSKYDTKRNEFKPELFPENVGDWITVMWEFRLECKRKYQVLTKDENLKKCMTILDILVETFNKENQDNEVERAPSEYVELENKHPKEAGILKLPDYYCKLFFESIVFLELNWKRGKEHEDLHAELSQRTGPIVRNSSRMPENFGLGIQKLVLAVDKKEAQEMFSRMVQYGSYDVESLREVAWKTYEEQNNIHGLFRTLDGIEEQVAGERRNEIQSLKKKIRDDYR